MSGKKAAEKEKRKDILFEAKAELTAIRKDSCRFRVGPNKHEEKKPTGFINITNLTHFDVPREHFPKDDDFSLDFINSDIDKRAKTIWKDDPKAVEKLKEKQAEFKKFTVVKIVMFR